MNDIRSTAVEPACSCGPAHLLPGRRPSRSVREKGLQGETRVRRTNRPEGEPNVKPVRPSSYAHFTDKYAV